MFDKFKAEALEILNAYDFEAKIIEEPPNPEMGDLAFPCFELAKSMGKNPVKLARDIVEIIKIPDNSVFKEVKQYGPYVNFFFDRKKFTKKILTESKKKEYGAGNNSEKIMVEYPAPNTNKPLHIGHMRNMAIGESISRIFEKRGCNVIRVNLLNDRGIHICKSMLAYKKWGKDKEPDKKSDHFVGDYYVLFANRSKENPELEKEAQEMLKKWESGDEDVLFLWKRMNNWAENGMEETFKRFGVKFDKVYKESEMYKMGKEMVMEGLKNNVFDKDDSGAIFFDLSDKDLDKKFLVRGDGTTLYVTQDLYLAALKYTDYRPDKSVYIVANEQNYHFDVLFILLEELRKLGFKFAEENIHLNYGMVRLTSGKIKSREGTKVDADDLMDEVKEMALNEIKKRKKSDLEDVDKLAEKIALGAIKFFLLKYSEYKDFTFIPKESLSLEGETGPYLQYSLVRAKKIIEKTKETPKTEGLDEDEEFELAKKISKFPSKVESAAENYKPHLIANYAYELSSVFSKFYEKCNVIGDKKEKERLGLLWSFIHVMRNCLDLLGIEEVESM